MTSKSKKKKDIEDGPAVVPVIFKMTTTYGSKGSFGYIPETFYDAWAAKGIVIPAFEAAIPKKETTQVAPIELKLEAEDEDDTEGESRAIESSTDSSISDTTF